jgi:thiosulfate/3-mercaptopyruvate sulfurtransferase
MKRMKTIRLVLIAFLVGTFFHVNAQDLIKANELVKLLKKPDVVVVSARKATDYKKVHIPNAVNVPHTELYKEGPIKSMLKPADEIASILSGKGVGSDKQIIVYDEGSGKYAGRLYWILKYMGAENVKMLDGNMKGWKAARKPITGAPAKVAKANFTAKPNASILAKIEEVKNINGNMVLIDVREPQEFAGTAESKIRKGHIPGAINIDFTLILVAKGNLKPADQLKSLFASKGVTPDKTIILYCETSTRAGIVYLALTSVLNYTKVKVYDGAYYEWQADPANKVG